MLLERVFADMQAEAGINILEEYLAQMIALGDNNRILLLQLSQISECRSEHRVSGDIRETACLIKLLQISLHGSDIGNNAIWLQVRHYGLESLYRVT